MAYQSYEWLFDDTRLILSFKNTQQTTLFKLKYAHAF